MITKVSVFIVLFFTVVLISCSENRQSPEDEIRQFIERGVEQAEKRSVSGVADMVHQNYSDAKGMIKAQVRSMLRLYFLRHKNIYLFTKIGDIIFHTEKEATVHLHVAMAGSEISDITALMSLRARVYEFELRLVKDDEWLLQSAKWQPARMGDMQ